MRIVGATFVRNEIEPGWYMLHEHIPLGTRYEVDLDRVHTLTLINPRFGSRDVACIWARNRNGVGGDYLPLLALRLDGDA